MRGCMRGFHEESKIRAARSDGERWKVKYWRERTILPSVQGAEFEVVLDPRDVLARLRDWDEKFDIAALDVHSELLRDMKWGERKLSRPHAQIIFLVARRDPYMYGSQNHYMERSISRRPAVGCTKGVLRT